MPIGAKLGWQKNHCQPPLPPLGTLGLLPQGFAYFALGAVGKAFPRCNESCWFSPARLLLHLKKQTNRKEEGRWWEKLLMMAAIGSIGSEFLTIIGPESLQIMTYKKMYAYPKYEC